MSTLIKEYKNLCSTCEKIDEKWAEKDYKIKYFPEIVFSETENLDLSPFGKIEDVVDILSDPKISKYQALSSFSDLYIKLYDNGRFLVEILNWWGSDINIHDHDCSGVQFQLRGQSLNVTYSFEKFENQGEVYLGKISLVDAKIWKSGDRYFVLTGRIAPHNVCHLSLPTVSLLIKTYPKPSLGPQWNYFPPGVAASYGVADTIFRKRVQALRLLAKGNKNDFLKAFRKHIFDTPSNQVLFTLLKMIDVLFEHDYVDIIIKISAQKNELMNHIIEATAMYRAAELMKHIKNTFVFSESEILLLSIIGSSFDKVSVEKAIFCLSNLGYKINFDDSITNIRNKINVNQQINFDNVLKLYKL